MPSPVWQAVGRQALSDRPAVQQAVGELSAVARKPVTSTVAESMGHVACNIVTQPLIQPYKRNCGYTIDLLIYTFYASPGLAWGYINNISNISNISNINNNIFKNYNISFHYNSYNVFYNYNSYNIFYNYNIYIKIIIKFKI